MITIKIVGLNYTINQHFFDCPHCGKEQEFIGSSPLLCRKCRKPMPAIGGFFEKDPAKRVRHLIMWHSQEGDIPAKKGGIDAIRI